MIAWRHRKIRITLVFILVGISFGLLYPMASREFSDPIALINGITIGLIGSIFLSLSELNLYNPLNRKMKFVRKVLLKTLFYTTFMVLLILIVLSITRSLEANQTLLTYVNGKEFKEFIWNGDFYIIVLYTLFISTSLIFVHQISTKMGQGVLLNLIFGNYHRPRMEERAFMFLDLNNSTQLAETMGEVQYNQFLNEFYHDITDAILRSNGRIYRYVGDEITVTWPIREATRNSDCLKAFIYAKAVIKKQANKYLRKYKIVPKFTAGFHCGQVIVGQVGDVKSQIVFSGKVLFEGSKIEKKCKKSGYEFLVSESLMAKLELPKDLIITACGKLITDDSSELKLYSVSNI